MLTQKQREEYIEVFREVYLNMPDRQDDIGNQILDWNDCREQVIKNIGSRFSQNV